MLKVASSDDACFLFMRMSSCADLGSMQQSNHCSNSNVVVAKKGREVGPDGLVRHKFILLTPKERKKDQTRARQESTYYRARASEKISMISIPT
mmetsp:Transcript_7684/g.19003  ORF Transcript_7684/g.19003 Transcript_7684/m.19003 type:complete len:94 (-) Transcript_7684:45-326(-)